MTNGEKIKELFPSFDVEDKTEYFGRVRNLDDHFIKADIEWWNAEYKEPNWSEIPTGSTDCISRQEVIDLMMQKWGENFSGDDAMQECIDAIRVMPSVTPQEPRWVPVSGGLPEVADCYAVTEQIGSDLIVSACYFDGINTWHNDNWINDERNYLTDIVAWMPLPTSYQGEKK